MSEEVDETPPSIVLRVGNVVSFVLALAANGTVGRDIGKVAKDYESKISADGWAFSIWSIIYLLLAGFAVYQYILKTERSGAIVKSIGPWFMVGNFFNAMWCITWTRNTVFWISVSTFMLFAILASNLIILNLARSFKPDNHHGIYEYIFIDVAFSIYASWTTVASILNVSITLLVNKWGGWGVSPSTWGAVMVLVAAGINIAVLFRCRNPIYPLVFVWASLAIYTKNRSDETVAPVSLAAAICVLVTVAIYDMISHNFVFKEKRES